MLERHTAGSRIDGTVKWTHLKGDEIARLLGHKGIEVSVTVVDHLLKKYNFPKSKALKTLAIDTGNRRELTSQ